MDSWVVVEPHHVDTVGWGHASVFAAVCARPGTITAGDDTELAAILDTLEADGHVRRLLDATYEPVAHTHNRLAEQISQQLARHVTVTAGRHPKRVSKRWGNDAALLARDATARWANPEQKISDMIAWVAADQFWAPNIMSPSKLRQQVDQIAARMNSQPARARQQQIEAGHRIIGTTHPAAAPTQGADSWGTWREAFGETA